MPRIVRCGLTQTGSRLDASTHTPSQLRDALVAEHERLLEDAAGRGVQILCFQELFYGPYFCAEQDPRWYEMTVEVPGKLTDHFADRAKRHEMAIVLPVYEREMTGVYYNTAAVYDADGTYLGKYRKTHIPHCKPAFWEKFYFKPGNLGYPVFETKYAKVGVYICYDRHFPEGARALGLRGAEIVFIPSATTAGHSQYLWKLEQVSHAVANGYFVGTNNRVGEEAPWKFGRFYGTSYFADPRGNILAEGPEDEPALVVADLDLDQIDDVRTQWQFFRDRRPEMYGDLTDVER